ncbi:MAG: sensor domain-containing diguanylate cyclase [Desulfarculaceae bacterium]|nr:sensor domain-containing diguanylate cyclase [Desulfarculaceae bacterium]
MPNNLAHRLGGFFAALVVCLLLGGPAWAGAMPLPPGMDGEDTFPWTSVLHDPTGKLSVEQVRAEPWAGRFRPFAGGRTHLGVATGAWWLRLEVHNASAQARSWLVQPTHPQFDQAAMFCFPSAGPPTELSLGDHAPFTARPVPHQTSVFPLRLAPGQSATLYLRLAYVEAGIADVRLRVWSPALFEFHQTLHVAVMALMIGALLMIALFNLVIAFSTRAPEYVWYVLYILAVVGTSLGYQGLGYRFFWQQWTWFTDTAPILFPVLILTLSSQFTRSFLKLKQTMPRMDLTIKGFIAFTLLILAAMLLGYRREAIIVSNCATVFSLVFPVLGLRLWLRGRREARYYTLAFTAWVAALALVFMRYFGFNRSELVNSVLPFVFMLAEALLLSMAMADRINILRGQKDKAERSYLEALRQDKQELERQVRERTAEIERMHQQALEASRTDMLTGLPNRRAFYDGAAQELERAERYGRPVSLIMLDIDRFKDINDTQGHAAGDEVLGHLAEVLRLQMRRNDLVGRLGGEEFALVLPETSAEEALSLAERMRATMAATPAMYQGEAIPFSASFGVARQMPGDSVESLLHRADQALYAAKAAGRNRVEVA